MSTSVEAQPPVAAESPPAKESPMEKKAAKEKKVRVRKEKKPKQAKAKAASHPPYFQMIKEALVALNDKSGSSPYAIAKFMEEKHKAVLPANFRKMMGLQLKNSVSRGKLVKVKASYKLSEAGKKEKGATAAAAKTSKKRETRASSGKKTEQKAKVVKKKAAAAAKPKQPRSIKSPAAKKAKKVSA